MGGCCTAPPVTDDEDGNGIEVNGSGEGTVKSNNSDNNNNNNNNKIIKKNNNKKETNEEKQKRLIEEERIKKELEKKSEEDERLRKLEEERLRKLEEERLRKLEEERQRRLKWAQKRTHAIEELITTEQTYVDSLTLCIKLFAEPLENMNRAITRNDHRVLFSDLKTIRGINEAFLEALLKEWKTFDNEKTMIGEHFIKFTPYFRQYQNYLNNYGSSIDLLFNILHNDHYNETLTLNSPLSGNSFIPLPFASTTPLNPDEMELNEETMRYMDFKTFYAIQRKKCDNKTLESLLILPIQRLPRYRMLLNDIVQSTEAEHPDLKHLQTALKFVEETANVTNERMKEFDARQIVREIEIRFVNPPKPSLVIAHRIFIKEGILTRINRKGEEVPTTFILFNDLLLYATPLSNSLEENTAGRLNKTRKSIISSFAGKDDRLKLIKAFDIDNVFHVESNERYENRLLFFYGKDKSTLAYCQTVEEKNQWLAEIQKVISKKATPENNQWDLSAPVWVPDTWSNVCQVESCGSKFTFVNRKHHCRYCGKLICKKCGKNALAHKWVKNRIVKPVCSECFLLFSDRFRALTTASLYNEDDESGSDVEALSPVPPLNARDDDEPNNSYNDNSGKNKKVANKHNMDNEEEELEVVSDVEIEERVD